MEKCKGDDRKFYSDRDKVLLLSLVERFKNILENKKTDATNWQKKNEAWKRITQLYNSNDVHTRTEKQLKKLWDNLKQRTRKNDSDLKKQIIQTGGGAPPPENQDPINEMVRAIVPTIGYVVDNAWDSTSITVKEKRQAAAADMNPKRTKVEEPYVIESSTCNNVEPLVESVEYNSLLESSPILEDSDNLEPKQDLETNQKPTTTNRLLFSPQNTPIRRVKRNIIEEEAALRIDKLKRSIEHQEELHAARMEAAKAEKDYWLKKNN